MNWKKGFIGLSIVLVVFATFSIFKLVDTNNSIEEIKRENKEISDKIKTLDSDNKKSKEELKEKDSDIEKINKELEDTKKELEAKEKEVAKKKEEKQLLAAQEVNNVTEQPQYKNLEQEVSGKYHEGIGMGMTHAEAYEYANGVPYIDEQALRDHVANITDEEANESVRKRDEFAASFEAEHGRQPTSGEIQSQWLKEQGFE
ncbi:hypothetical protein [Vagococcus fluvialis]|uniref:hypothetical protein n=1 Tax=Vagococcus fluvialis TaxID=2738 RepID=UPI001D0A4FBF|nr:hypothetical protein [Vagococcus fluvialis]UDM73269.1 hypothetical protein K5K99_10060 [Vagococcus fluvialis]